MARLDPGINIRMPEAVKAWVVGQAAANRRSINSEVVYRLESAMRAEKAEPPAAGEASRA